MRKRTILALLGLGLGLSGLAAYHFRRHILARLLRLPPVRNAVAVERGLRVPMPDGVALAADHYFPQGMEPGPTILIRSPYGRGPDAGVMGQGWAAIAHCFAERGYHVVVQDVRGGFGSAGEFTLLLQEEADGLATLEWLERQPWFNGVLGMWGPSYLGYAQWAVATNAPPALQAVVPSIAFSSGYRTAYQGGALALDTALRAMFLFDGMGGRGGRPAVADRERWARFEEIVGRAFAHLPLQDADLLVIDQVNSFYRQTLAHPRPEDPFWQQSEHHDRLDRVTAAPLLFSGWYDLFLDNLLDDYQALRAAGRAPFLTIGPWYHVDLRWLPVCLRESLAWYDAHLRGDAHALRRPPVRIYLMGADEWREMDDWPPPAAPTRYFLQPAGGLAPAAPPPEAPPDRYRYDPADPTPHIGGPLLFPPAGPLDQRPLEARPDVLCYTTPPLAADLDVIGPVRLELYVCSSLAHTDFLGRLCDVYPDGRSINVCDGLLRLVPGSGEPQPDGTLRIVVETRPTAQRFRRGHRLRLHVASGGHPRWNRNLGLGEAEGRAVRMAAADQEVYHDAAHPSALVLPVVG